jgi:hypothetical protein
MVEARCVASTWLGVSEEHLDYHPDYQVCHDGSVEAVRVFFLKCHTAPHTLTWAVGVVGPVRHVISWQVMLKPLEALQHRRFIVIADYHILPDTLKSRLHNMANNYTSFQLTVKTAPYASTYRGLSAVLALSASCALAHHLAMITPMIHFNRAYRSFREWYVRARAIPLEHAIVVAWIVSLWKRVLI